MDEGNLRNIFRHINDFWDNKTKLDEWHEGQVVPVTKKGHIVDPNKWRGVYVMDIGSKVLAAYCVSEHLKSKQLRQILDNSLRGKVLIYQNSSFRIVISYFK